MNKQMIDYTVQLSKFISWTNAVNGNHRFLPTPKEMFSALHAFAAAEEHVIQHLDRQWIMVNRALILSAYSKIIEVWSMHHSDFPLRAFIGGPRAVMNSMQNDTAAQLARACNDVNSGNGESLKQRLSYIETSLRRVANNLTTVGHVAYAGVVMLFERWANDCVSAHLFHNKTGIQK